METSLGAVSGVPDVAGSDDCEPCSGMSSSRSRWCWLQWGTIRMPTAHAAPWSQKNGTSVARPGLGWSPCLRGGLWRLGARTWGARLLGAPPQGPASDEAFDARTLSFLLAQAVAAWMKEEEKEMEQLKAQHKVKKVDKWELEMVKAAEKHQAELKALQQHVAELAGWRENTNFAGSSSLSSTGKRRNKKKRRRKRTRRTISRLRFRCVRSRAAGSGADCCGTLRRTRLWRGMAHRCHPGTVLDCALLVVFFWGEMGLVRVAFSAIGVVVCVRGQLCRLHCGCAGHPGPLSCGRRRLRWLWPSIFSVTYYADAVFKFFVGARSQCAVKRSCDGRAAQPDPLTRDSNAVVALAHLLSRHLHCRCRIPFSLELGLSARSYGCVMVESPN